MDAQKRGLRYALFTVGLIILALMVMDFNNRMADLNRLTAEQETVRAQATALVKTQLELTAEIGYASSDQAVSDWAYRDGHMVRRGDNPVVPVAVQSATATPTPTPTVTQVATHNWENWLSLFIGPLAP
jgi:hypothetical protein